MTTLYTRHFVDLKNNRRELSDSELLNSNNQSSFSAQADVAICGAGIIGFCYAIQLKTLRPGLNISLFEKSQAPCQKIGESTLSSFSRWTNGTMLPNDYLLRLFAMKDGLQFYCLDEEGKHVTSEDIGGLDLSFQLDRRMSELFFTMWAQSLGIQVYHGVEVDFNVEGDGSLDTSSNPFGHPELLLKNYPSSTSNTRVNAPIVTDASGFSRKLTGKFGNKEMFPGYNCDAYWAYFRSKGDDKAESRLHRWDYPATKHMCFPEGWGWFIKLISWEHAPLANLMDMCAFLIDNARRGVPPTEVPCAAELSRAFGCSYEYITSIGWAVRNDHKFSSNLESYGATDTERKFMYFQRKYPTLNKLMNDVYELLPNYYGKQTYFVRKGMTYRSPVVSGNGWFAIGNSAGFTNPLISPGINAGIETAFLAAKFTNDIFAAPESHALTVMRAKSKEYQTYSHDYMVPRLHRMNRFWYSLFRDHRLFDALVKCYWVCSLEELDTHYKDYYDADDLQWLVGAGRDGFHEISTQFSAIVDPHWTGKVTEEIAEKTYALSREVMAKRCAMYPRNAWGRYLRHHNDTVCAAKGKMERDDGGNIFGVRCKGCKTWFHNLLAACPVCGTNVHGWFQRWLW